MLINIFFTFFAEKEKNSLKRNEKNLILASKKHETKSETTNNEKAGLHASSKNLYESRYT